MRTLFAATLLFLSSISQAQIAPGPNEAEAIKALRWRSIGPWRAGRSLAVAGHANDPNLFYFGAVGGGVWKSVNGGIDWLPVSDSTFKSSSVGAITVAPSDPNIVYVGMGETEIRGNISYGDGMYRSLDGGKSWQKLGLEKTWAISHIAVHPTQPDVIWVSALGSPFAPGPHRGVYKSADGGKTWRKTLFINDSTGAVDIRIDPKNSRVLYASTWQCYRNAYTMSSGGKGSGLYKSIDGGETWQSLSQNPGMPLGTLGKIGVAPAADGSTVYALIESKQTGLYKSLDAGKTWKKINEDKNLTQRPWYYMHIYADPQKPEVVYVLNVQFFKSVDGGFSFKQISIGHSDNHDLWVNPSDPQKLILASDGGAEVSSDGGRYWTAQDMPTAQFYHVSVDDAFPFNIYGAQQDNSAVCIPSRSHSYAITGEHWYAIPSGESGYVAAHPQKPGVAFGGNYMGSITRYDHLLKTIQQVMVYPENHIGSGAENMKYRFNWTFPLFFSKHEPGCMYVTSQMVHKSCDEGMSWQTISPDLTTNDKSKQKPSGGPLTGDNTGAETHCSIFTLAESPVKAGVLWAGSDDGLVHLSTDAGKNWQKLNLPELPASALISIIEASPFDEATAYLAATRYKWGDNKPYLFRTQDYGKTWKRITNGIPSEDYTRVIREDPNEKGLLYAGTENGIYVSFNNGEAWTSLNNCGYKQQDHLPRTPIHDIALQKRDKALVVATHGRSFWVIDNLSPLHQKKQLTSAKNMFLQPAPTYRTKGYRFVSPDLQAGQNPSTGVVFNYLLTTKPSKELKLYLLTAKGDSILHYSSTKNRKGEPVKVSTDFYEEKEIQRPGLLMSEKGMNTFEWDMRYPDAEAVDGGSMMWGGSITGPMAIPGLYKAHLYEDSALIAECNFEIKKDPRLDIKPGDLEAQLAFHLKVNAKLSETHKAINRLRKIRKQVNEYLTSVSDTTKAAPLKSISKPMQDTLNAIEEELIQTKAKAFQDLLNFPVKLNNKLASIASMAASADTRPPAQCEQAYTDIATRIDVQLTKLKQLEDQAIPAFNAKASEINKPAVELR